MSRVSVTIVFVLLLLIELFVFVLPQLGGSRRPDVQVKLYLLQRDGVLSVLDQDTGSALYGGRGPYPDYEVYLSGWRRPGPLEVLCEFYETRRFNPPWIIEANTSGKIALNDAEQRATHDAVIRYAKNDPVLGTYNPGGAHVTRFAPWRLVQTLLVWLMLCTFPAAITALIYCVPKLIAQARQDQRAYLGQCVRCAYDCRGLNSETCPECGSRHGIEATC